ncbi:hypothetical protein [Mammaliicoccus phage vB_MscM-PMS3]|nr:hypothetical protein [Mammaliicoccus phage vB_MscM-PMS3]
MKKVITLLENVNPANEADRFKCMKTEKELWETLSYDEQVGFRASFEPNGKTYNYVVQY